MLINGEINGLLTCWGSFLTKKAHFQWLTEVGWLVLLHLSAKGNKTQLFFVFNLNKFNEINNFYLHNQAFIRVSILRLSPANFVLFTGDFRNRVEKTSSVSSTHSFFFICSNSGCGLNLGSLCCLENRFQGQTS
jgi:hypothetical protein